jgi:hypothetical protein
MAKFVPGPLVSSISGRIGQVVFTSYKGVGVIKKAATSVYNPNSPAQQDARAYAQWISDNWDSLTEAQQDEWAEHVAYEELSHDDGEGSEC